MIWGQQFVIKEHIHVLEGVFVASKNGMLQLIAEGSKTTENGAFKK